MKMRILMISVVLMLSLGSAVTTTAATSFSKDQVIAEVERLGGKVEMDETLPTKPIVKIDLHATKVTDAELMFLANSKSALRYLRYVDLRLTHIGNAGAAKLKGLTTLESLNLFRTQVGNEGLGYLKKLTKLQTLLIGGTRITDEGLANLKSMKELKKLSLFQTRVTDACLPHLKVLPKLEQLLISGTNISDAGARELLKALPRLRFDEST